ncbi:MAG: hypothetical protein AABW51_02885 [Nanoarchaeota archaeon]
MGKNNLSKLAQDVCTSLMEHGRSDVIQIAMSIGYILNGENFSEDDEFFRTINELKASGFVKYHPSESDLPTRLNPRYHAVYALV